MEQLLNQLSVWGMAAMGFTTLRITWSVLRAKSPNKLSRIFKIFSVKSLQFIRTEYKSFTLALVSILSLYWAETKVTPHTNSSFYFSVISFLFLGNIALAKFLQTKKETVNPFVYNIFAVNAPLSLANVWLGLAGLVCVLSQHQFWGIFDLLGVVSYSCLAASMVVISYRIWQYNAGETPKAFQEIWLSAERQESLLASVACAMFLGVVFQGQQNTSLVGLPAGLCMFLLAFSVIQKALKTSQLSLRWKHASDVFVKILFLVACYGLVTSFLPVFWLKNGQTFYALDVFYAMLTGVLASLFSDQILRFYQYIQDKYTAHFLKNPKQHLILTYLIRFVVMCLCVGIVGGAMLYAYKYVGLYGLSMMLIGLLSNLNMQLSITPAKLH